MEFVLTRYSDGINAGFESRLSDYHSLIVDNKGEFLPETLKGQSEKEMLKLMGYQTGYKLARELQKYIGAKVTGYDELINYD